MEGVELGGSPGPSQPCSPVAAVLGWSLIVRSGLGWVMGQVALEFPVHIRLQSGDSWRELLGMSGPLGMSARPRHASSGSPGSLVSGCVTLSKLLYVSELQLVVGQNGNSCGVLGCREK